MDKRDMLVIGDDRPERQELVYRIATRYIELNEIHHFLVIPPVLFDLFPLPTPHWIKAHLWQIVPPFVDRITWIDSDCVPVGRMPEWPDAPFAAIHDISLAWSRDSFHSVEIANLPAYFNAGVFSCTRESIPAFRRFQEMGPVGAWYEQGAFNLAVHRELGGFAEVPFTANWIAPDDYVVGDYTDPIKMIHLAGNRPDKDEMIDRLLRKETKR